MHVVCSNSNLPPNNQTVTVVCPKTLFNSGMDRHYLGKEFIDVYAHDIVSDLVKIYIEYSYQAPKDRSLIYADFMKDQYIQISSGTEYIYNNVFEKCENADDNHPTWHENIMQYFSHRADILYDAIQEMYLMFHTDIFYPIMDMVTLLKMNALTLTPGELEIGQNYYKIEMTIMENEYAYHDFDDETDYPCAPFRLGVPTPPTVAHIRRDVNWG